MTVDWTWSMFTIDWVQCTLHTKKQCTPHRCISLHSKYKRNLPLKQCCGVVVYSDQLFVYFVTMFFFVWNMIIIKKKSVSWTKNLSCPSIKKYFCGLKNLSLLLSNNWVTFICSIFCLSNQSILLSLWNNIYVAFNWSIFLSQQSEYFSVSVKQYLCGLQEPALESLITAVVPLGPGNLTWPPPYRQLY